VCIKVKTSTQWRHWVTWRHQWRDHSTPFGHFPAGSQYEQSPIFLSSRDI